MYVYMCVFLGGYSKALESVSSHSGATGVRYGDTCVVLFLSWECQHAAQEGREGVGAPPQVPQLCFSPHLLDIFLLPCPISNAVVASQMLSVAKEKLGSQLGGDGTCSQQSWSCVLGAGSI